MSPLTLKVLIGLGLICLVLVGAWIASRLYQKNMPKPSEISLDMILEAIKHGETTRAVTLYRRKHEVSLKKAKSAVDEILQKKSYPN